MTGSHLRKFKEPLKPPLPLPNRAVMVITGLAGLFGSLSVVRNTRSAWPSASKSPRTRSSSVVY